MNCKFCKSQMRYIKGALRVLVCDDCGYFEAEKQPDQIVFKPRDYPPHTEFQMCPFPFSRLLGA